MTYLTFFFKLISDLYSKQSQTVGRSYCTQSHSLISVLKSLSPVQTDVNRKIKFLKNKL